MTSSVKKQIDDDYAKLMGKMKRGRPLATSTPSPIHQDEEDDVAPSKENGDDAGGESIEETVTTEPTDNDDNFREVVCPDCMISELLDCTNCGLYQYGYKHKAFKFKATKL